MVDANSLIITVIVGGVAGWLAGLLTRGSGYGLIGDVVVGLIGAVLGAYLLRVLRMPVHLGNPLLDKGAVAFLGAVVLQLLVSLLRPRTLGERMSGWWRRR